MLNEQNETENTVQETEEIKQEAEHVPPSAIDSEYPTGAPQVFKDTEKSKEKLTAYAITTVIGDRKSVV